MSTPTNRDQKLGELVTVRIEVSKGSLIKRNGAGTVDFVSPLPSPFNYGSVVGSPAAEDGEPVDAVVLGSPLRRGCEISVPVRAVVRFLDAGHADDKLVCKRHELNWRDRARLRLFFYTYSRLKTWANWVRRTGSPTRFRGLHTD